MSFLTHCNSWIKINWALPMVWCFYFIHAEIFLPDRHISKIGSKWLWIYIICPIRDTNDRTSKWKFQYVQYEIKWWFWRHTCTCSCKLWPLRATIIYIHLHVISPNSITPESNITVMRIKEMITNWRDSWFSDTGPSQYQRKCIEKWCWGIKDCSK